MSKPRQSLNRMVPWNQLLDLLGAKIQAMGLPTRCRCPLCQEGVLRVDEDPVVGGQWFSCQRCGKHGDMIELAAAVWNLDIPATVARLARHGLMPPIEPKTISRYEQQHVQYRRRLNGLWKDAQAGQIFRSHTLQRLLDRLGLHAEGTEQAWNKGPGCLIGKSVV